MGSVELEDNAAPGRPLGQHERLAIDVAGIGIALN